MLNWDRQTLTFDWLPPLSESPAGSRSGLGQNDMRVAHWTGVGDIRGSWYQMMNLSLMKKPSQLGAQDVSGPNTISNSHHLREAPNSCEQLRVAQKPYMYFHFQFHFCFLHPIVSIDFPWWQNFKTGSLSSAIFLLLRRTGSC